MPVKRWDNLKDPVDREAGRQWSEALDIPDLTTRELDWATNHRQADMSDDELREGVLKNRKK